MLCRTMTVDTNHLGLHEEIELVPNGKQIPVTTENRHEFVRLFIDFEFKKQCEKQIEYFKKGFERMVDI